MYSFLTKDLTSFHRLMVIFKGKERKSPSAYLNHPFKNKGLISVCRHQRRWKYPQFFVHVMSGVGIWIHGSSWTVLIYRFWTLFSDTFTVKGWYVVILTRFDCVAGIRICQLCIWFWSAGSSQIVDNTTDSSLRQGFAPGPKTFLSIIKFAYL